MEALCMVNSHDAVGYILTFQHTWTLLRSGCCDENSSGAESVPALLCTARAMLSDSTAWGGGSAAEQDELVSHNRELSW